MKKVIFRTLALAFAALLLIPLASCGKDKPTPTPPDPKPAGREDIIGKLHTIAVIFGDKETPVKARTVTTYDKQLRPQSSISERLKDGKLVPDVETFFTYDASGRLIEEKSREVGFGWDYKRYKYKDGLLVQFEDLLSGNGAQKSITQYTYGLDRKKEMGIYIFAQGREDGTHFLSYSYEGEVEVEASYSDPERKNLIARNKRTYDKEGRVIKLVATTIELRRSSAPPPSMRPASGSSAKRSTLSSPTSMHRERSLATLSVATTTLSTTLRDSLLRGLSLVTRIGTSSP